MKNIVLYAPPAAGKGTVCEYLTKEYNYEIVSIGQVLRNARTPETEIGRKIIETQDKGILTPDDIVAEALKQELDRIGDKPIVIEGYPRNIAQAKLLDGIFNNYIVINIHVDRKTAMERTLGRVTCSSCGKIYNIYTDFDKPEVDNVCNICGAQLEVRSDDNEKSFNVRYDVYEQNAPEILAFYKEKSILNVIDGAHSREYTNEQMAQILDEGKKND